MIPSRFSALVAPVIALGLAGFLLAGCQSLGLKRTGDGLPAQKEDAQIEQFGRITGDGINFGGPAKPPADAGSGITVNAYLWRAALDSTSFMPLISTDPFGGVIITDWYSAPESLNERFKLTLYVLDRQLRSDGIRVSVFKQHRAAAGSWEDVAPNPQIAADLEVKILTRARQMRISQSQTAPR